MVTKMHSTYKALVLEGANTISIKQVEIGDGRYAKMLFSGVCGTDKHAIKGHTGILLPRVLGHENVGIVDGRRYTWPAIIPCNECDSCHIGMYNVCEEDQVFGLTTTNKFVGGWGEYTQLPNNTILYELPKSLASDIAVLVETVTSTKPLRQVDLSDKNLLIVGSGAIGLVGTIHARYNGVKSITLIGNMEQAQHVDNLIDNFYEKNHNTDDFRYKFDVVYDAGGSPESFHYSVSSVKPGGIVLESACMVKEFPVDITSLIRKEARVLTQWGYVPDDFIWAMRVTDDNQGLLGRIITHRFELDEVSGAIDVMENIKYGKILFGMQRQ